MKSLANNLLRPHSASTKTVLLQPPQPLSTRKARINPHFWGTPPWRKNRTVIECVAPVHKFVDGVWLDPWCERVWGQRPDLAVSFPPHWPSLFLYESHCALLICVTEMRKNCLCQRRRPEQKATAGFWRQERQTPDAVAGENMMMPVKKKTHSLVYCSLTCFDNQWTANCTGSCKVE